MFQFVERLLPKPRWMLTYPAPKLAIHDLIEARARGANRLGPLPLWSGYRDVKNYPRSTEGSRTSDQVRTSAEAGRFYTALALSVGNPVIIEIGTAFGVSGMYWLAGIGSGHLHTFEPNEDWGAIARQNLASISPNFTLYQMPFEEASGLPSADVAFIDAIHTSDFVNLQFELLKPLMKRGSFILFDDINFSDDMRSCWKQIARDHDSSTIAGRVGIIRLSE